MGKFKNTFTPVVLGATLAAILSACGGGGGGSNTTYDTTPATTSFPVQQALTYAFTHGLQATLAISGNATQGTTSYALSGTLSYSLGIATSTTFEGATVSQSAETLAATISANGISQPLNVSDTVFLNAQYVPVGSRSPTSYCVAAATANYPANASAGQSGDIVTMNCYADSTKRTLVDIEKLSYVTTAGSEANTLNFQLVTTDYGLTNTPVSSNTVTYTISANGVPKLTRVQLTGTESGISINLDAK